MVRISLLVLGRELLETLRDPHVLAYAVFPVFAYPALVWVALQVALVNEGWTEKTRWHLSIDAPPAVTERLLQGNVAVPGGEEALRSGAVDAVVRVTEAGGTTTARVVRLGLRPRSVAAADQVEERLGELRSEREAALRADHGWPAPLAVETTIDGDRSRLFDRAAALLLGLIAPTMAAIAALYPAVDLVAGERERSTLETTLVSPVPRRALLLGRFTTVTTLTAGAATLNAAGLLLALVVAVPAVTRPPLDWVPRWSALVLSTPVLLVGSAATAAVFLLVLLPTRTFKEGEQIGSMAMTVLMGPPFLALPGLLSEDPPTWQPWVPFTNVAWVVGRACFDDLRLWEVLAATGVDLALTAVLVGLVSKVLFSEDFLFGHQLPRWLAWLRRWMPA